jgi:dihydrofolate reductase
MRIRTHFGVSADGFVSTRDGRPSLLSVPGFIPGVSHGHPEFIADCDAVLMGRNTFEPALGADSWPWGEMPVFLLTSRPLPPQAPPQVEAADNPSDLLERIRARGLRGDVHLVGGPSTAAAFVEIGALDRLEVVVLPIIAGEGTRLLPAELGQRPLKLESHRHVGDGSVELVYSFAQVS